MPENNKNQDGKIFKKIQNQNQIVLIVIKIKFNKELKKIKKILKNI